jgi:hypothetical protein
MFATIDPIALPAWITDNCQWWMAFAENTKLVEKWLWMTPLVGLIHCFLTRRFFSLLLLAFIIVEGGLALEALRADEMTHAQQQTLIVVSSVTLGIITIQFIGACRQLKRLLAPASLVSCLCVGFTTLAILFMAWPFTWPDMSMSYLTGSVTIAAGLCLLEMMLWLIDLSHRRRHHFKAVEMSVTEPA